MNEDTSVSVIVAIFNVEKYLERCLESIAQQSYKNIEVILVDDGSTDSSPKICDEWEKKDNRFRVIHKINGGLADARNAGLKASNGNYVCFVDGDDYIERSLVKSTLKKASGCDADVVVFSNYEVNSNGEKTAHYFSSTRKSFSGKDVMNVLFNKCIGTLPTSKTDYDIGFSPWGRLCKRKVLIDNNIYFKSERKLIYEDLMFLLDLTPVLKKVEILNEPLYDYCNNAGSLTRKYDPTRFERIKEQYYYLKNTKKYYNEIFVKWDTLLRFKRTMLGYVRNSIARCLVNHSYKNTKRICSDDLIRELLEDYPINKLPIKQKIFDCFLKLKLYLLILLISKINNLAKK